MSRMAKAPSSTGLARVSGWWAAVTWEEQGTIPNTPICSGGSPVRAAASFRARMAASSMGVMVEVTLGMSLGKRIRMRRRMVGQAEEIWGMTRFSPLLMCCRA
jgi:hypothetical protein